MEFAFWLVIIFALLYEPIVGYFDFRKFKLDVKTNEKARIKYYINSIIGLWVPTIFILLLVAFTDLTYTNIGLTMPTINTEVFGPVITYSAFGIALLYLFGIFYYLIGYRYSVKIRNKLLQVKEKELGKAEFSEILPTTKKEKKLWNYVSITAGVTEEIIYRGFLIFALAFLFPNFSIWLIILLASLLFGLAHTYQGLITGILRTTVLGIIFSILYIGLGSILPLIVFHFLIDYFAKFGEKETEKQI
ncbi:CAAX protease [Anaerobacillus alkalidiazotrophicus]|uniref:CAAX protease n=1 Tax=Anaerobacillus alkalidiazotrophicus TaxID=472963 RepID=A0A1S2LVG1_9BACI|nr:CPBP family intramembrane glutamic endopeptidase [Anaerobacillus alkalidiazotrophicus]OIJ16522.1 CAAX protease [Anaerobacillus alkalidiazotrophicus]